MSGDAAFDEYERRFMDPGESVVLREKVVSKLAFRLGLGVSVMLAAMGIACGVGLSFVQPIAGVATGTLLVGIGAAMATMSAMFSVYRVMITGHHVHVHFGWARRKIALGAIERASVVQLRGFKQGKVQIGLDGVVRTHVGQTSSGRAVEIRYTAENGRKHVITFGSDAPERIVEAIERVRASAAGPKVRVEVGEDAELEESETAQARARR